MKNLTYVLLRMTCYIFLKNNRERSFPTSEIVETITPTVAFLWIFQQDYPSYSLVCSVVMEMDLLPCELSNCNDFNHFYFQGSSSFFKCSEQLLSFFVNGSIFRK